MDKQKAVLVTGASRGIGKTIALALASQGYTVFAGMRDPQNDESLRQIAPNHLFPIQLDIKCPESIQAAVELITQKVGSSGLYGLVNNAGILISSPIETLNLEALREQLEVNVVAQVAVTQSFLPLIRRAQGRIINMSSVSGIMAVPFLGAYCASKFALEAISESMRLELAPWGVKVSLVAPSFVNTTIWETAIQRKDQEISATLSPQSAEYYTSILNRVRHRSTQAVKSAPAPDVVAKVVLKALQAKAPRPRYSVGRDAKLGQIAKVLPSGFRDWLLCERFGLDITERLT